MLATASVPIANECIPTAVPPNAARELVPFATERSPKAVELIPKAWDPIPHAVEFVPFAIVEFPHAEAFEYPARVTFVPATPASLISSSSACAACMLYPPVRHAHSNSMPKTRAAFVREEVTPLPLALLFAISLTTT